MLAHKLHELRAKRAAGETGFTLVELLVVVVIIVALAAIAVPIFLNQKDKADAAANSADLAGMAKFISAGMADGSLRKTSAGTGDATGNIASTDTLYSSSGTFSASGMTGAWGADGFCVTVGSGVAAKAISNNSGGVQAGTCNATTFVPAAAE